MIGYFLGMLISAAMVSLILVFKIWLFGSLITSSVKSISGDCGITYPIEKFVLINGSWFCNKQ